MDAFNAAVEVIKHAGATVIDNTNITANALAIYNNGSTENTVLDADFVADLPGEYLSMLTSIPNDVHNLAEVSNFTHHFPQEDYPDVSTPSSLFLLLVPLLVFRGVKIPANSLLPFLLLPKISMN